MVDINELLKLLPKETPIGVALAIQEMYEKQYKLDLDASLTLNMRTLDLMHIADLDREFARNEEVKRLTAKWERPRQ